MSTVTLSIGPKSYTIACADGQEAHIKALGAMIAEKYAKLGASRAPLEAQNLLFAALFLADDLAEARKHAAPEPAPPVATSADLAELEVLRETVARLERDLEAARAAARRPLPTPAAAPQADLFGGSASANPVMDAIAERLEALAARAEANAAALEAVAASA